MSQDAVTVQTSRAAIDLRWAASEVFAVLGAWASEADNPAIAVSMATTSRHLSWHVADLEELISGSAAETGTAPEGGTAPEAGTGSEAGTAPEGGTAPEAGTGSEPEPGDRAEQEPPAPLHPEVAAALQAIREIPGTVPRLGIAHRVLIPRLAVECVLIERTAKPDEQPDPVATIAGAMLADLRSDRDDGEVLLAKLIHDIATVQRVGERVLEAERHLVATGGLVPVVLT